MDLYMDEKWKLSKKSSRCSSSSRREQSSSSMASSSSGAAGCGSYLKRSSSMPESVKAVRRGTSSAASSPRSFSSRCANLVKEQRAKFYIMRRCVTMLICWRDYP